MPMTQSRYWQHLRANKRLRDGYPPACLAHRVTNDNTSGLPHKLPAPAGLELAVGRAGEELYACGVIPIAGLELAVGFEPTTCGLQNRCSTVELR